MGGGNVDLDSRHEDFDKDISELIYLFKNSGRSVFVFEDIDRFEENIIFSKLVEINKLLNANGTKYKFIYPIRLDTYTEEQTKVFDTIVDIIPVISKNNMNDKFIELLVGGGLIDEEEDTIKNSLYNLCESLPPLDMRTINNIVNDYIVYRKR